MTFRARLQLSLAAIAIVTVGGLGLAVRRQMAERLTSDYEQRVTSLVDVVHDDLNHQQQTIRAQLRAAGRAIVDDNRLRAGLAGNSDRAYLLDFAPAAMRLAGLSMLQIEDATGHVLSSGNFRNEFGRVDSIAFVLPRADGGFALTAARRPEGSFLALVRADSTRVGETVLYLVGGVEVDAAYLRRLARDGEVTLVYPGDSLTSRIGPPLAAAITRDLDIAWADNSLGQAKVFVRASTAPLDALLSSVNQWTLLAALVATAAALIVAWRLSTPLSRPIVALANDVAAFDLERSPADFTASERDDEIGVLARGLGELADRLRRGASQLRDAERRATTGDLARQVNHDVKNGLVPIRNVLKHLAEVAHDKPGDLPQVFKERKDTLDQGVAYLETLAANYARLTPSLDGGATDVGDVLGELAKGLPASVSCQIALDKVPNVRGDRVVVRRILENLVNNAVESMNGSGQLTLAAKSNDGAVRVTVTDQGPGMSPAEIERAFEDFYTTKPRGTGLGLSIVRRLVSDLGGTLKLTSKPGSGTTVELSFPSAS